MVNIESNSQLDHTDFLGNMIIMYYNSNIRFGSANDMFGIYILN
jgi:hypothetical protein